MVPQPQFELGKVPETQSGTWGNLVPHMCKSHQTTSVKTNILDNWMNVKQGDAAIGYLLLKHTFSNFFVSIKGF